VGADSFHLNTNKANVFPLPVLLFAFGDCPEILLCQLLERTGSFVIFRREIIVSPDQAVKVPGKIGFDTAHAIDSSLQARNLLGIIVAGKASSPAQGFSYL
jgi:hypothetical protein